MSPAELKAARKRLGLSQRELGALVGFSGDPGRTIRKLEAGAREIGGPLERLVAILVDCPGSNVWDFLEERFGSGD